MDPDTLLSELLDNARAIEDGHYDDRAELAAMAENLARDILLLDAWLLRHGRLPQRWNVLRRPAGSDCTECGDFTCGRCGRSYEQAAG